MIVFLKAPRAGAVKTRLAATIGAEAALSAHRTLVDRVISRVGGLRQVELRFAPDDAAEDVRDWLLRTEWVMRPQGDGDLGARLKRAFEDAFAEGARTVSVIGSDCPWIEERDVFESWARLERSPVVLGPASDGGYWLVGLRDDRQLFGVFDGIDWSTDRVSAQTIARAREMGIEPELLRELSDVDTIEDWRRFAGLEAQDEQA